MLLMGQVALAFGMFATVMVLPKLIRSASEEVASNGKRQDTTP